MNMGKKGLTRIIAILSMMVLSAMQFGFLTAANADPTYTDLSLKVNSNLTVVPPGAYLDFPQFNLQVCNLGTETITSFSLAADFTNFDFDKFIYSPQDTFYDGPDSFDEASTPGSINDDGVWTGVIESDQCIGFYPRGTIGEIPGVQITDTFTIISSKLTGNVTNIDTNPSNDSASGYTVDITDQLSDLALTTRVLTEGTITPSTTVSYELNISNVGNIADTWGGAGLYVLVPAGVTNVQFSDGDINDTFSINTCEPMGMLSDMLPSGSPPFADAEIYGCEFQNTLSTFPAGASYKINMSMTAGASFSSGQSQVVAAVWTDTNEFDSARAGTEFLEVLQGLPKTSNNLVQLVYDSGALAVTVNRCNGQANPTPVDDACFTITFNKPIWAPSFEIDDLILNGGGTIYEFTQLSDTQWRIKVNGMTLDGTVEVLIVGGGVIDLSAVPNDVHVLGENTIRYSTAPAPTPVDQSTNGNSTGTVNGTTAGTKSAVGTLAATGTNVDWQSPAMILLAGICLMLISRRRSIA